MRRFIALLLALALLSLLPLLTPAVAEEPDYGSGQFERLNLYFYGDLDETGDEDTFNTTAPLSDTPTESDSPQDGNRVNWDGSRNWQEVGAWLSYPFGTNVTTRGKITFDIWAKATQGSVKDVQYRVNISLPARDDPQRRDCPSTYWCRTFDTNTQTVDDRPVHFSAEVTIGDPPGQKRDRQDLQYRVGLEYSGGDAYDPINPDNNQIVVLTSAIDYDGDPETEDEIAGLTMEIDHYRATFSQPVIDNSAETATIRARIYSGFGIADIAVDTWELTFAPENVNTRPENITFVDVTWDTDSVLLEWVWYYAHDNALSDAYTITVSVDDIQGNRWYTAREEPLYMLFGTEYFDDYIKQDDVTINNQTGIYRVPAGQSFTLDIRVRVDGDETIAANPVPVRVYLDRAGNSTLLFDSYVLVTPADGSKVISFRHAFSEPGQYSLRVVLNEDFLLPERYGDDPQGNNVAFFLLEVVADDSSDKNWLDEFRESLEGGGTVALLTGLVAVLTTVIIVGAVVMRRRAGLPDDEAEWDDDF